MSYKLAFVGVLVLSFATIAFGWNAALANVIDLGGGVYGVDGGQVNTNTNIATGLEPSQFFNDFYVPFLAPTLSTYNANWSGSGPTTTATVFGSLGTGTQTQNIVVTSDTWTGSTTFAPDILSFSGSETIRRDTTFVLIQTMNGVTTTTTQNSSAQEFNVFEFSAPFTPAVPAPIAGAGLPGLILASGGLLGWWRRRKDKPRLNTSEALRVSCSRVSLGF